MDSLDPADDGRSAPHPAGRRYSRQFNLPTGLEPGDRVDLVIRLRDLQGRVSINGRCVGAVGPQSASFPITALLKPRNVIVVEAYPGEEGGSLEPTGTGDFPGEIRLEITAPAT